MKMIGIVIDVGSLPTFENRLTKGGFAFEKIRSETADMILLMVETNDIEGLGAVVSSAQIECALRSTTPSTLH